MPYSAGFLLIFAAASCWILCHLLIVSGRLSYPAMIGCFPPAIRSGPIGSPSSIARISPITTCLPLSSAVIIWISVAAILFAISSCSPSILLSSCRLRSADLTKLLSPSFTTTCTLVYPLGSRLLRSISASLMTIITLFLKCLLTWKAHCRLICLGYTEGCKKHFDHIFTGKYFLRSSIIHLFYYGCLIVYPSKNLRIYFFLFS